MSECISVRMASSPANRVSIEGAAWSSTFAIVASGPRFAAPAAMNRSLVRNRLMLSTRSAFRSAVCRCSRSASRAASARTPNQTLNTEPASTPAAAMPAAVTPTRLRRTNFETR